MTFTPCADHEVLARWSEDPVEHAFSRRCARCGVVVERLTRAQLDELHELDVPSALMPHRGQKYRPTALRSTQK